MPSIRGVPSRSGDSEQERPFKQQPSKGPLLGALYPKKTSHTPKEIRVRSAIEVEKRGYIKEVVAIVREGGLDPRSRELKEVVEDVEFILSRCAIEELREIMKYHTADEASRKHLSKLLNQASSRKERKQALKKPLSSREKKQKKQEK